MTDVRNTPLLVALFILMLEASVIWAAEEATEAGSPPDRVVEEASVSTPEADDQSPDATQTPPSGEPSDSEVFIPTEEISEDFAVSFPVDI